MGLARQVERTDSVLADSHESWTPIEQFGGLDLENEYLISIEVEKGTRNARVKVNELIINALTIEDAYTIFAQQKVEYNEIVRKENIKKYGDAS